MTLCPNRRVVSLLVAFALVALGAGCASEPEGPGEKFEQTRRMADNAPRAVDSTLVSLRDLRSNTAEPLPDMFARYKASVDALEKQGLASKEQAAMVRQRVQEKIEAWQKEVDALKDPSVKATMEARRQAVQSNYKLFTMYVDDARNAYTPFLQGNKDLVRALTMELSPAAIKSLAPSMDKVTADGQTLKQKLAMVQKCLNDIAKGVSPVDTAS